MGTCRDHRIGGGEELYRCFSLRRQIVFCIKFYESNMTSHRRYRNTACSGGGMEIERTPIRLTHGRCQSCKIDGWKCQIGEPRYAPILESMPFLQGHGAYRCHSSHEYWQLQERTANNPEGVWCLDLLPQRLESCRNSQKISS